MTVAALFDVQPYWFWHPVVVFGWCLAAFVPLRLTLGGDNYLPSRAWYLLCFIIPGFVAVGLFDAAFCIPLQADWQTVLHIALTLAYLQLDLCVARLLVGPGLGTWSLPALAAEKLSPCPTAAADGLNLPGAPPLARTAFELNGALFHEIFWNLFICQNCIDRAVPVPLAILAVPAASCIVHGIVCNFNTGLRCFPCFVWVALAYHASGSVLPPALIHSMWYFLDAKLCFALKSMKRDWDIGQRRTESATPPWDRTCTVGLLLIVSYYVPLNFVVSLNPSLLRSSAYGGLFGAAARADSSTGVVEGGSWLGTCNALQIVLAVSAVLQIAVGAATWRIIRAGMDVLAQTGDLSEAGVQAVVLAMDAHTSMLQDGEASSDEPTGSSSDCGS